MRKMNLVMIVRNEERSLQRCLEAARPLVDEMLITDTGSSDRTVSIAERMGARVSRYTWTDDFSAARNFALEQSDADWNLMLDADEYLRPCRRQELEAALSARSGTWLGSMTRYDSYRDEEGISVSVSVFPKLLPRGVRYSGRIHEQPAGNYPCFLVPLSADHDGYLYTDKGERNLAYLERAAEECPEDGYYQFQLASTLRNLKRLPESLAPFQNFYRLAGRSEGYWAEGVVLYLYTLLDLETAECLDEAARIVEAQEPLLGGWPDFCFVCDIFYMKRVLSDVARYIGLLPNIERCYRRCLEIGENPRTGGVVGTGSFKAAYNLGAWYEVSAQTDLARQYYEMAARQGYAPAAERLKRL